MCNTLLLPRSQKLQQDRNCFEIDAVRLGHAPCLSNRHGRRSKKGDRGRNPNVCAESYQAPPVAPRASDGREPQLVKKPSDPSHVLTSPRPHVPTSSSPRPHVPTSPRPHVLIS